MTQKLEIYKCDLCGNIVEVLHEGAGDLVCCGEEMKLKSENTQDAATEKHVPVVEQEGLEVTVKVGEIPHPMTEEHLIEWIEVITDKSVYRRQLTPQDKPQAKFTLQDDEELVKVREYCNLHGLWAKK